MRTEIRQTHQKAPGRMGELEWGSESRGRLVGRKGAQEGAPGKMERGVRGVAGIEDERAEGRM